MAQQTMWDKVKTGGKAGFDKTWHALDKIGAPVNRLSNKLGSESFWPTTLDKECDKAARILRSFCKDGFYQEETTKPLVGPTSKQRVLKKIPTSVIRNALGLAIFTTMRTGLWVSGAGGSGVLVARKEDGMWSPPSGILLHTAGLGFLVGVDIYDCVIVLNSQQAVDAFSKLRCTIGGEISAVAGPAGIGGVVDSEVHKRQAPLFTYLKSRGFYAGVQVDGTIVIERADENERFYGYRVSVTEILAGKVRHPPMEINTLMETIRAAQGEVNVNEDILPDGPPPADYEIEDNSPIFGIPDKEDPDPYGVLALEKEGLVIREAGTQKRVTSEQFDFKPSATSPIYANYRKSLDGGRRESWRNSSFSVRASSLSGALKPNYATSTASTQTDFDDPTVPGSGGIQMEDNDIPITPPKLPPRRTETAAKIEWTPVDTTPTADNSKTTTSGSQTAKDEHIVSEDEEGEDEEDEEEEPVVYEVVKSPTSQVISKPRVVTVPKLAPPTLPPRNPTRGIRTPSDASSMDPPNFKGDASIRDDVSTKDQAVMTSGPPSPMAKSTTDDGSFKSASSKEDVGESVTSSTSPPTRPTSPQHTVESTKQEDEDKVESATAAAQAPTKQTDEAAEGPATPPEEAGEHHTQEEPEKEGEPPMSDVPLDEESPKPTAAAASEDTKTPKADALHFSLASIRDGLSPVKTNDTDYDESGPTSPMI